MTKVLKPTSMPATATYLQYSIFEKQDLNIKVAKLSRDIKAKQRNHIMSKVTFQVTSYVIQCGWKGIT